MPTIRPNAEPAATTVAAGDIFLIDGATGVRALAATSVALLSGGVLSPSVLPAFTGDMTTTAGSVATSIAANTVTNAKLAQMPANTIKCNPTGGTATAIDSTSPVVTSLTATTSLIATTSMISPTVAGGGSASSPLLIESTFGTGTSDYISFLTGSQVDNQRRDVELFSQIRQR